MVPPASPGEGFGEPVYGPTCGGVSGRGNRRLCRESWRGVGLCVDRRTKYVAPIQLWSWRLPRANRCGTQQRFRYFDTHYRFV